MVVQTREAEYLFKIIQFNLTILIHPGQPDLFLLRRLHYIITKTYIQIIIQRSVFVKRTVLTAYLTFNNY